MKYRIELYGGEWLAERKSSEGIWDIIGEFKSEMEAIEEIELDREKQRNMR